MLNTLAEHNPDIKQLLEKGYALSIDSDYLVVRDVSYLDESKNLQIGSIISKIDDVDKKKIRLHDHQIFFCGSHPCQMDGTPVLNMGGGPATLALTSDDLVVQRNFSHKPEQGYADFFEKVETYVNIICGPAIELHGAKAHPWTFRTVDVAGESVFKFRDTLTSRAEIGDLSLKFKDDVIAIIGLGGTGSYLLDFLVKTPVNEIRGFDLDSFHVHNAFRSPGKLEEEELGKRKAEVYQKRYNDFRFGISIYSKKILSDSTEELQGVTFAFICVDKGSSRSEIINLLIQMKITFIDVGMGLDRENGPISGILRTTYFSNETAQNTLEKNLVPLNDLPDEIYRNNIQISELNALNACLAVMKYKQLRGFYVDDNSFSHSLFTIDSLKVVSE
ncbi:MAG: ThiF family adenylyltransferase [Bacteroidetes bacterium]|nr:ThiF family adenylyltransferase [Bacteroidota bacterium]